MKKQINQMAQILQKHNLGDHIPEVTKRNPKDHAPNKGNSSHALIAINSSPYAWIVDSGASHHMDTTKEAFSLLHFDPKSDGKI